MGRDYSLFTRAGRQNLVEDLRARGEPAPGWSTVARHTWLSTVRGYCWLAGHLPIDDQGYKICSRCKKGLW
jgi:hypothetical protein